MSWKDPKRFLVTVQGPQTWSKSLVDVLQKSSGLASKDLWTYSANRHWKQRLSRIGSNFLRSLFKRSSDSFKNPKPLWTGFRSLILLKLDRRQLKELVQKSPDPEVIRLKNHLDPLYSIWLLTSMPKICLTFVPERLWIKATSDLNMTPKA